MTSNRFIDLSHCIHHGMQTYPGLPAPLICDFLSRDGSRSHYEEGTTFHIGRIDLVANTGTYLDAPFHRYEDGKDIGQLDLASLANLEGRVIRIPPDQRAITPSDVPGGDIAGCAVLFHTGWDRHWGTPAYFEGHPFLVEDTAKLLLERGAALVGIDSLNIDDTRGKTRPVHSILLRQGVPIVEHLCGLEQLPRHGFAFSAVPPKVRGLGTFPVRAYALSLTE